MVSQEWSTVQDAGPTLAHHWGDLACLLCNEMNLNPSKSIATQVQRIGTCILILIRGNIPFTGFA